MSMSWTSTARRAASLARTSRRSPAPSATASTRMPSGPCWGWGSIGWTTGGDWPRPRPDRPQQRSGPRARARAPRGRRTALHSHHEPAHPGHGGDGHGQRGHSHHGHGGRHGNPEDLDAYIARLEDPARDEWQRPDVVVAALGLRRGQTAGEIGGGPGYWSLRLARKVGAAGRVYAVDRSEEH